MENKENITKALVKELCKKSGKTTKKLIENQNAVFPGSNVTPQNFSNKLTKETLRVKELALLAAASGFELRIVKKGTPEMEDNNTLDAEERYFEKLMSQNKSIYVHCKDEEASQRFLRDCEYDGFAFESGEQPTEYSDLYEIIPGKKIKTAGFMARMLWNAEEEQEDIFKIEY